WWKGIRSASSVGARRTTTWYGARWSCSRGEGLALVPDAIAEDPMHDNKILILDYGSQFTQLIARRIREERVYCEIHPPTVSLDWIRGWNPRGLILSGGPASVYGDNVPSADPE